MRGNLDVMVDAVPSQLTQVFANLIGNAVKYLGDTEQPCVEIGATDRADHIECVVQDTKPVRFAEFMETIKAVKLYWLLTNRLPV